MHRITKFTPEMREYFERFYNIRTNVKFCEMFNRQFGTQMSVCAAKRRARLLGLSRETPANWLTIADISRATGLHRHNVKQAIDQGRLTAIKPGRYWLIQLDEAERFIKRQNDLTVPPPWRWITTGEASERLGLCRNVLNQAIGRGSLPYKLLLVNNRRQNVVPLAIIEAGERKLKATGHTKLRWDKLTERWNGR